MAKDAIDDRRARGISWRIIGWGTAALLLALPWIAGAPWTAFDYGFAAMLFGSVGLAFELVVRKSGSLSYRIGAALAVIASVLILCATGGVGMIGNEGDSYNLLFLGVILIAFVGAIAARFRPAGMALAMVGAGVAHLAVAAVGLPTDPLGGFLSIAFAAPWLLAAAAFRSAASEQSNLGAQ